MKNLLLITLLSLLLTGCGNKQIFDTHWIFNHAVIEGVGEVEISSWNDYEGSDMIQVTSKNGITYLTHSSNVILISK